MCVLMPEHIQQSRQHLADAHTAADVTLPFAETSILNAKRPLCFAFAIEFQQTPKLQQLCERVCKMS